MPRTSAQRPASRALGLWCIDQVDLKIYKFDYESGEILFEAQTDTAALQRHYPRRRLYVDRLDL